jgi:hypothetical protein
MIILKIFTFKTVIFSCDAALLPRYLQNMMDASAPDAVDK